MKELLLKYFFEGHSTAKELDADIPGTLRQNRHLNYSFDIVRMDGEFQIQPAHLIKLIDAALSGSLNIEHLAIICDVLDGGGSSFQYSTDRPEGERVADVLSWISEPKINYPLTKEVLNKMRRYLETGENTLTVKDTRVS